MANIPVEKKSSSSWIAWLLGLLALLVVVWLFFELFVDEGEETTPATTEQVEPSGGAAETGGAMAGGVITSAATLFDASNPTELAGRDVQLSSMRVTEMLGDSAFYATSQGGDQRLLVALNEQIPSSPSGVEGRYDVNAGQLLDIDGSVRTITREADAWGLSDQEAEAMRDDAIYVRAQSLTIVEESTS